jgi:hypothetical protein
LTKCDGQPPLCEKVTGGANVAVVGMGYRGLLEVEGGVGGGELVPAATAAGTATTTVAASPQRQRSTFLDLGEPMVPGLARHPRRRQCGHGATLAPSRLEGLLALAVETRSKGGSAPYCAGATGPDPTHGRRKSIVGTAKDPSRIGEARVQSVRQNRRQVHATTHTSKAITGLAVIPEATRSDHLGV